MHTKINLYKIIIFCLFFILLFYCNQVSDETNVNNYSKTKKTNSSKNKKIIIQPLGQISILKTKKIERALKQYYRGQIVINGAIPLPNSAASSIARKYHAHKLLKFLSTKTSGNSVILGVTEMDICTNKNGYPNFGIFGLGQRPGNSCVISTCRLSGNNTNGKLTKVALHEIGHTQGLTHCLIPTCLMSDLKGRDRFNEMALFCNKCKSVFNKKGWAF
jgi:archaemetzincin